MLALVTGASSGIGWETALYLAEKGYDLILTARNEERLRELAERIESSTKACRVRVIPADLSKREECLRLWRETRDDEVDFLVNSAGLGVYGEFADTDLGRELDEIAVNVTAVHILTKLYLRGMLKRNEGVILNVGSSAGFMAGPSFAGYYASKNYVVRLTEAIHEELRHRHTNVKISVLCPGPVETDFDRRADVRNSMRGLKPRPVARYGVDRALKGRMLIVPGAGMRLGLAFSHILPDSLMVRITYQIQKRKGR